MPGLALALSPRRYDAVVKSLNGKLMLPLVYGASRARGLPFVLWTGMWHHPRTGFHRVTRPLTRHVYRWRRGDRGLRRARRALPRRDGRRRPGKVFVAGQAVEPERFTAVEPARNGEAEVLFIGQFEERKGLADLLERLRRARRRRRAAATGGQRVARARGHAARGAGPARGRRRLPAPGAPSRDARARALPRAAVDHHGARPRAVGPGRQRGDARRRAGHRHRRRGRGGGRPGPSRGQRADRRPSAIRRRWPRRSGGSPPIRRWRPGSAIRRGATSSASATRAMADAFEAAVEHAVATSSR